ncbi:MAG: HIT domain-containing protein [bacterium]
MKYLYAPWRDVYFERKKQGCIFCRASKSKSDGKNFVIFRGKRCFAMLNIFPYTTAHVMIAPYRHCADLCKLKKKELSDMMEIAQKMTGVFKKVFKCRNFNIGINQGAASGAGFAGHIHLHVVGRWPGDVNFMTAVSKTRVISSAPEKIYGILKKQLR